MVLAARLDDEVSDTLFETLVLVTVDDKFIDDVSMAAGVASVDVSVAYTLVVLAAEEDPPPPLLVGSASPETLWDVRVEPLSPTSTETERLMPIKSSLLVAAEVVNDKPSLCTVVEITTEPLEPVIEVLALLVSPETVSAGSFIAPIRSATGFTPVILLNDWQESGSSNETPAHEDDSPHKDRQSSRLDCIVMASGVPVNVVPQVMLYEVPSVSAQTVLVFDSSLHGCDGHDRTSL
jgi:hypothetical protein